MQAHALLVGALAGILSTVLGLSLARADVRCRVDFDFDACDVGANMTDTYGPECFLTTCLGSEAEIAEVHGACDSGGYSGQDGGHWYSVCESDMSGFTHAELEACESVAELVDCSERSQADCDLSTDIVWSNCLYLAQAETGSVH
ncbi:MAG TPA: hypothetical protein VN764_06870 [Polyangiaceae bacterium]|nr:hypothetical protein [Polyangiaceae bacterium]